MITPWYKHQTTITFNDNTNKKFRDQLLNKLIKENRCQNITFLSIKDLFKNNDFNDFIEPILNKIELKNNGLELVLEYNTSNEDINILWEQLYLKHKKHIKLIKNDYCELL